MAFRFSTPTSRSSSPDFFQVLDSDAGSILVGGKDAVFNLSLADLSEFTDEVRIVSCPKSILLIVSERGFCSSPVFFNRFESERIRPEIEPST